jgi:hypothetical protein
VDLNRLATRIVRDATDPATRHDGKDPGAVERGRKGGQKGGRARAERMTPEERSESARHAARTRWGTPARPE